MIHVDLKWFAFFRIMMTSSNGNIFRITGHLCGEFTSTLAQGKGYVAICDRRNLWRCRDLWLKNSIFPNCANPVAMRET